MGDINRSERHIFALDAISFFFFLKKSGTGGRAGGEEGEARIQILFNQVEIITLVQLGALSFLGEESHRDAIKFILFAPPLSSGPRLHPRMRVPAGPRKGPAAERVAKTPWIGILCMPPKAGQERPMVATMAWNPWGVSIFTLVLRKPGWSF